MLEALAMVDRNPFRVVNPCPRAGEEFPASGAREWCSNCGKHVYDFAQLKREEIARLCSQGGVCGRLGYRADGSLVTADGSPWPVAMRRQFLRWAGAAVVSVRWALAQKPPLPALPEGKSGVIGVVVDPSGTHIPGARVAAGGLEVQANQQGQFVLGPLAPGEHTLRIRSAGFSIGTHTARTKPGVYLDAGPIALRLPTTVGEVIEVGADWGAPPDNHIAAVLVDDGTGQPVAGLHARLVSRSNPDKRYSAKSDDGGQLRFTKVYAGSYELVIEAIGWAAHRREITVSPAPLELGKIIMRR